MAAARSVLEMIHTHQIVHLGRSQIERIGSGIEHADGGIASQPGCFFGARRANEQQVAFGADGSRRLETVPGVEVQEEHRHDAETKKQAEAGSGDDRDDPVPGAVRKSSVAGAWV